jgi:hypothetical protein
MKTLLIALLVSTVAIAKEECNTSSKQEEVKETQLITTDVPSHLKGATIIVRLADGRESKVPAESFKVVPRKQQRIVTKLETKVSSFCRQTLDNKNRISLLGGHGPNGRVEKTVSTDQVEVETRNGIVGGLQYQRSLNEKLSIGVQGQTNRTGSLMIGLDF